MRHRRHQGRLEAHWLGKQDLLDPEAAMAALQERRKDRVNYSLLRDGLKVCHDAAVYARAAGDDTALQQAATFADALLRKHVTSSGGIIEWDRNTWLEPWQLWRTIPWGVNFSGNQAYETWLVVRDALTPEQQDFWRQSLERTGEWIYGNPVVGGYVFNCGIDLCALLWRLGDAFDRPVWKRWAVETASARIARDIDDEGWIQAEDGGSSGFYQMVGADLLARFAWESQEPVLIAAVHRLFARSALPYASPALDWPGNYGTRTSRLRKVSEHLVLAAAAFGDRHAAHFVQTFAHPGWPGNPDLWRVALATPTETPSYPAVARFEGIDSTVLRFGPWAAYFNNYDRATWTRGFTNLWHTGHGDWVFSTLHSLAPLDSSLQAKSRLDPTADWAGFPHVRVAGRDVTFESQQRIDRLDAADETDAATVRWTEPLLARTGATGGTMDSDYRFEEDGVTLRIALRDLAGAARVDFHFMRRQDAFVRLWVGNEVADILAGRLLSAQGHYETRRLPAGQPRLYGVQVNRTVFAFEVIEAPAGADISLVNETPKGLHTGDLTGFPSGGFRFRIDLPETDRNPVIVLRLRARSP